MAFAPQGHDLDNETQDEGRQSPAPRANGDASNSDDNPSQTQALATVTPVTGETPFDKPMILREILQFLSIEQLKTCKLVSKKWYRAAKHALSLKPGFRLQLPLLLTPPLQTCTGLSCETTVVAVPDPTAEAAATPQATPEDTHETTSEVAPLTDRDRVRIFLENFFRGASRDAWQAHNPLRLELTGETASMIESLKPAAVSAPRATLSKDSAIISPNLQHVRHLYLHAQRIPAKDFEALATATLYTLDLSDATLLTKPEKQDQAYNAFFQLHKLTTLTDLNLARFTVLAGNPDRRIGPLIDEKTRRQSALYSFSEELRTRPARRIANNPISFLVNLKKLNLEAAGFPHGDFLAKCPALKVLHLKNALLSCRDNAFLNALPPLEELTPHSLICLVGEDASNTPARIHTLPNLRRLNLAAHKVTNAHLKCLSDLQPPIEELAVSDSWIRSNDAGEGSLQTQGHLLLGSFPKLTKLDAVRNPNLRHLPVFVNPTLLTELIFTNCGLKSFEGLNQCINLRHLIITDNPVTVAHAWQNMTNLQQLRTLVFSQKRYACEYDEQSRADCINVLTQNTYLNTLNLNGHPIGPTVADALANKYHLRILHLGRCRLGDDGFQKIPLLNLEELDVSTNELTAQSVQHLCHTLRQVDTPHLRHLNLQSNVLGDDVMLDLANLTFLKELFLNGTQMTEQGARHLAPLVLKLHKHDCEEFAFIFIQQHHSLGQDATH